MKMNKTEILSQLQGLQSHCAGYADAEGAPWSEDVEALTFAIDFIRDNYAEEGASSGVE